MKKMLLMPAQQLPSPLQQKLSRLDLEMKAVLDRSDLDDATKASEYNLVLGKYLQTREQLNQPTPIPILETTSKSSRKVSTELFPVAYRRKAGSLLQFVEENPNIDWNERNELVVDSQPIPDTNIIDLVDDLSRPNTKRNPRGIDKFVRALQKHNIPESFIANRRRLQTEFELSSPQEHTPDTPQRPNTGKDKTDKRYTWKRW